jgi:hypothetical protein
MGLYSKLFLVIVIGEVGLTSKLDQRYALPHVKFSLDSRDIVDTSIEDSSIEDPWMQIIVSQKET